MLLSCHLNHSALSRPSFLRNVIKTASAVQYNTYSQSSPFSRKLEGQTTWQTFDKFRDQAFIKKNHKSGGNLAASFSFPSHCLCVHQSRRYSIQQPNFRERQDNSDSENFTELYLVNNIRYFRILCRFSRYSFLMFLAGSPLIILSSFLNMFPVEILRGVFSSLAFYMFIFTGQSFLFTSRIVAKIMVSEDGERVKISRLTLFGNRKDLYVKPSDIIKFHFYGAQLMSKNMLSLRFHNQSERLIFLPSQGGVYTNYEALEMLFCSDSKKI